MSKKLFKNILGFLAFIFFFALFLKLAGENEDEELTKNDDKKEEKPEHVIANIGMAYVARCNLSDDIHV